MTEFVAMGLLPDIAAAFRISIPAAGHLISAYALGVVLGAPLLTVLARKLQPRVTLAALMALFALGNLLSALAPNEQVLLITRVLSGLPHGAFFGVGAVVAGRLAPRGREAQVMALMFLGLSCANVVGVPLGTFLGQTFSWRVTFAVVSAIGAVAALSTWRWIPPLPEGRQDGLRVQLRAFGRPEVWLVLAVTMVGFGAMFAVFTYIVPMMTRVAGFSAAAATPILMVAGLGMVAGNLLGGRLADRAPLRAMRVLLLALAGVLAVLHFTAPYPALAVITVFVFTTVALALGSPLQLLSIRAARGAETLASATNQSAFNVANALGAYLGGLPIAAGFGYATPALVGVALALAGLVIALGLKPGGAASDKRVHLNEKG